MNPNVLMTDTIFPDTSIENSVFQSEGIDFRISTSADAATLSTLGGDADALLVVYAEVTAEVIHKLDRCKVIVKAGIGYNNVDVNAASDKGIIVANVPDYCHDEVADHTFGLFLSLSRKVCFLDAKVKSGVWDAKLGKNVPQLRGKTFGLLGYGAIGQQVAVRAKAFGMKVVAYDPFTPSSAFRRSEIQQAISFDDFLKDVDFLSLHAPLSETTRHIIDKAALAKMKNTALVINTSRGGLIDEEALYDSLVEGKVAGAALDVLEVEPPVEAPALSRLENVVITPHTAFLSDASVIALRTKASEEIVRVIRGEAARNAVN